MKHVNRPVLAVIASFGLLAVLSVPANAQSGSRGGPGDSAQAPMALEGYCPVSLVMMNKWVKGAPANQTVFDGHTYLFANEKGKKMFVGDPAKYVPVLGGDCAVSLVKMGKRVPGNIRYSAWHDGRLFLFANENGKKMFLADPKAYANADLADGGNCAVCRVEMKATVPGKPEFTVFHNGMRYQFPNAKMRDMFLANPKKYAVAASAGSSLTPGSGTR